MAVTERRLAIGIDVGGTKIAGGLVDLVTGEVIERRIVPTLADRTGAGVLTDVLTMSEELLGAAGEEVVHGIGVGVPELVDPKGNVRSSHAIAWEGVPVREWLAHLAPTTVEADVRAAALAEARYGAGRGFDSFVFVTVGTGISSCLVLDGRPFAGARGNALVLTSGQVSVPHQDGLVWSRFVPEAFASGPAIVARYRQRTGRVVTRAEDVIAAMVAGDETALVVVESAAEALGSSIGSFVNVIDPAAVIVGGGLGVAGGHYWKSLTVATRKHIWSDETRELPIIPAALGPDAGLIGAAATVEPLTRTPT
jgi:glucokinase